MKVGVVLTKKGGQIPNLELYGLSSRLGRPFNWKDSHFYTGRGPLWRFKELAYARVVGKYEFSFSSLNEIPTKIERLRRTVLFSPSFAVEGALERELGWWLDGKVDLRSPSNLIFVYKGKRYHVLSEAKIIRGKDFSPRDSKNRPFFHPSSMNARDARFLVNVAGVMPGDIVLDPFCGAGVILIEAGILGAKVIGVDIDAKMVRGCEVNLRHYGVRGEVIHGDARKIDIEADVVVTDPPYGRSTKLTGKIRELYLDAFENIHTLVRKRFVVVLPFEGEGLLERSGFEVLGKAYWYVHSSLTRRVYLCSP